MNSETDWYIRAMFRLMESAGKTATRFTKVLAESELKESEAVSVICAMGVCIAVYPESGTDIIGGVHVANTEDFVNTWAFVREFDSQLKITGVGWRLDKDTDGTITCKENW